MTFSPYKAAEEAKIRLFDYLILKPEHATAQEIKESRAVLSDIIRDCGPVVESYPTWHPLVKTIDHRIPETEPTEQRYPGIDHTRYFTNGFITCPYDDGESILDAVDILDDSDFASFSADRLDVKFYHPQTTAILVKCEWNNGANDDGSIRLKSALPAFLEMEVPLWRKSECAETWKTMHRYLLGGPCNSTSSPFIRHADGMIIRSVYESMIRSGMYGPIKY